MSGSHSENPRDGKYRHRAAKHTFAARARADPLLAVSALGSALPKSLLPPFRSIGTPLTTLPSVTGFGLRQAFPTSGAADAVADALRLAKLGGRAVSRIATPLTIAEGAYDWGALAYCAVQ
jgi:hypothetical protein